MAAARRRTARGRRRLARDAVAVELLLTCSMRVGNLVDLRLGETIRRFGEGTEARWAIEIPGAKVKNRQPLRFILPPDPCSCSSTTWPTGTATGAGPARPGCSPTSGAGMSTASCSRSASPGAPSTMSAPDHRHQFRHLAAELYLREDPNGLGLVSQHLGHRDLNTTRRYYAREQTRVATQRYHEVLSGSGQGGVPGTGPEQEALGKGPT